MLEDASDAVELSDEQKVCVPNISHPPGTH